MEFSLFFLFDQYDDQPVADIYQQVLRQSLLAESLGFYGIYCAEHHFENYGVLPNPAVMLAHIASQTTTLKLGTAATILPLHHPLRVAEEIAMVDLLSNGRAELGLGSGFLPFEFSGFGLDSEKKRDYFDDALPTVEALLRGDSVGQLKLNLSSHQNRALPVYVAAVVPQSAYYIGLNARRLMAVPFNRYQADDNSPQLFMDTYREGYLASGQSGSAPSPIMNFFCHVADSDALARTQFAKAFGRYVKSRTQNDMTAIDDHDIYDLWLKKNFLLCGSVETVSEKIEAYRAMGLEHIMTFHHLGGLDEAIAESSIRLFSQKVMPNFQNKPLYKDIHHESDDARS